MKWPYAKVYTAEEVARVRCAFEPDVKDLASRQRCELVAAKVLGRVGSRWVRRRVKVDKLATAWREKSCGSDEIRPYVERRERGGRFPPVFIQRGAGALPWERWITHDGNHRVRAAQCVGDEYIDAFIPMKRRRR
jgi:hypothetical protein